MFVGSRVLCVSQNQVLLVQHRDPVTNEIYWLLPGGAIESGETPEEAAVREVKEETGIDVVLESRLDVPTNQSRNYAIFVATPIEHRDVSQHVDENDALYWTGALWCPVTVDRPLGRMNPSYWDFIAPVIRALLNGLPAERCNDALST